MVRIQSLSSKLILDAIQGKLESGNKSDLSDVSVDAIGEPAEVIESGLTFIISSTFLKHLPNTKAAIVVIQQNLWEEAKSLIPSSVKLCMTCEDAYLGLAKVSKVIAERNPFFDWNEANLKDKIDASANIDTTTNIAAGVCIGANVKIGARTVVHANVVIGPGVEIGEDCVLFPGCVLYPRTIVKDRVRLHANVVLGADGFGYARGQKGSEKIWHLGIVCIESDVEIGAGTTVDRGTIKNTIIEQGAKLDNLVQVGHNVHIKSHAILCAQTGLAGNATIGRGAILAGKAGVADKINVGDGAVVGPSTGVSKDVSPGQVMMGAFPGRPKKQWWKLLAFIDKLPDLVQRVKALEKKLEDK